MARMYAWVKHGKCRERHIHPEESEWREVQHNHMANYFGRTRGDQGVNKRVLSREGSLQRYIYNVQYTVWSKKTGQT